MLVLISYEIITFFNSISMLRFRETKIAKQKILCKRKKLIKTKANSKYLFDI